ncbi:MAG: hypothetical protein AAF846_06905 [Chloroflexota bacterium]
MDKTKRKGEPLNLRRYWLIFGLLTIILLFPFRIAGGWVSSDDGTMGKLIEHSVFNSWVYRAIIIIVLFSLFRLLRVGGRNIPLILLMCVCVALAGHHQQNHIVADTLNCTYFETNPIKNTPSFDWILLEPIWCSPHVLGAGGYRKFLGIKNTNIVFDIGWVGLYTYQYSEIHYGA